MKNLECGRKFETARNAQDPDESRHGDPPGVPAGRIIHAGWVGGFKKSLGLCRKLRQYSVVVRAAMKRERDVGRAARVMSVVRIANLYVEAEAVARCRQPRLS